MKINIVGDGSAGRRHERMLRARGHTCTVLGPAEASPVAHPACDAVVIASPPMTHKLYLDWYWNLCPMLCEGPVTYLGNTYYDTPRMLAENWWFTPPVQRLASAASVPVSASFWFDYRLQNWRPGTNYRTTCYYTDGIDYISVHELAVACALYGSAIESHVLKYRGGLSLGVDAFSAVIRHGIGTLTTVTSSWFSERYVRGFRVVALDGHVEEANWRSPEDDAECNQSYEDMLDAWLQSIRDHKPVLHPSLEDGYNAWRVLNG